MDQRVNKIRNQAAAEGMIEWAVPPEWICLECDDFNPANRSIIRRMRCNVGRRG